MTRAPSTLLDLLEIRSESHADRPIYTFVRGDAVDAPPFGALYARALRVAVELAEHTRPGDRALLLFPFGEEVLVGLMGALLAGVVSVPLPISGRRGVSFAPAAQDAGARVVLTDRASRARLEPIYAEYKLQWIAVDDLPGDATGWRRPPTTPDDLAWLQYTSGSTGAPRGVRVRHGNAVANSKDIAAAWGLGPDSRSLMWVPHYHDDGLVNGLLQPLATGFRAALMDPFDFISRPDRWLRWIGALGATHAGGPNFTYEVTLRKVSPAHREGLDLSSWEMAYNAAEPVRADTLRRFYEAFAPCGLRWTTLRPAYGMAETTLLVTTSPTGAGPLIQSFDAGLLRERGVAVPAERGLDLASSGRVVPGTSVRIWDPETRAPLPDGRVGEILVQGPGVTGGYWNRPEVNADIYGATLPDAPGTWLRTGDLGFLLDGELFVTGRQKDLIIVAGANYAPQDVEAAVEASDPAFRPGCTAAFGVPLEAEAEEGVVVVAELRDPAAGEVSRLARRAQEAIGEALGLRLHALVLLAPEQLPKTSSGKVRRRPTRTSYLDGTLPAVQTWVRAASAPEAAGRSGLRETVLAEVARRAGLPADSVDPNLPFASLGLRSIDAVAISDALSQALGRPISVLTLFEHPTVHALTAHLSEGAAPAAQAQAGERGEPVAIIGMACRFPGAPDIHSYWTLVSQGGDAIQDVPEARWRLWEEWDPGIRTNPRLALRTGGFLPDLERFDAAFFGISPREASKLDPQQRLAMTLCWEALADAGVPTDGLAGTSAGVFAGALDNEYGRRIFSHGHESLIDAFAGTGGSMAILANRLSYLLDAHGPSMTVDTACSSSLVALHLAVGSLRRGESDLAIVVGTNLILTPGATLNFSMAGALSRGGRPRPFDAGADGFVRSEGAAALICKRLSDAIRDGDRIHAVVRGTSTVQDGRTNGLMAPSQAAQEATLRAALRDAGVEAGQVSYVETHGTGTPLGDPIEAGALGAVFGPGRSRPLRLGSAKANVGHLEGAAGAAGLIKATLALQHRAVPPMGHFQTPNPLIDVERWKLEIPTALVPWEGPLLAGVSSFGFGGANAHAVLEAAPASAPPAVRAEGPWILPFSARSREALVALAGRWRERLAALGPEDRLADLLYTASVRRAHEPWRAVAVGGDAEALSAALASPEITGPIRAPEAPFWLLSGHGSQQAGMPGALPLPAFQQGLDAALGAIRAEAGDFPWPLVEADLDRVARVQPAIFAVQIALGTALEALGVRPAGLLGHSMGEVAAACLAGALTLPDAARVIVARSRLLATVEGQGAMLTAPLPADEALSLVPGLSVAVESGPRMVVMAGTPDRIDALEQALRDRGLEGRRVRTAVAFHSPQMEPLMAPLRAALQGLQPRAAALPLWSTVTGARVHGAELGPDYWARNLRDPVRFGAALEAMAGTSAAPRIELSPHPLLASAARQGANAPFLPTLRASDPPLAWVGALYRQGYALRWGAVYPAGAVASLPAYPWQAERHWTEVPSPRGRASSPLLGAPPTLQPGETRRWTVDLSGQAWLRDHRLHGAVLAPAALVLEVARAAGREALGIPVTVESARFEAPWFPERAGWTLETALTGEAGGASFELRHPQGAFASGHLRAADAAPPAAPRIPCEQPVDADTFHAGFRSAGLVLGPAFQAVRGLQRGPDGVVAELVPPEGLALADALAHPALLDAVLRVAAAARPADDGVSMLPVGLGRMTALAPLAGRLRVTALARPAGPAGSQGMEADLWVHDEHGRLVLHIGALAVRRVTLAAEQDPLYEAVWEPAPPSRPTPGAGAVYLIADRGGRSRELARDLEREGVNVTAGDAAGAPGSGRVVDLRGLDAPSFDVKQLVVELSEKIVAQCALIDARPSAQLTLVLPDSAAGAALAGAARAARLERPDAVIRTLTLAEDGPTRALAAALLAEDGERELRLSARGLELRRLAAADADPGAPPDLRGPVLISGGLGALGLVAAAELARRGARELILLGRSAPGPAALAQIAALRAAGCAVELWSADVTDGAALRRALSDRTLAGVVHAAGWLHDAPLASLRPDDVASVLAPKLGGALALHELAGDAGFFVLFGSVAGLWGNAGQVAYSAANAAMAAFAGWRRAQGLPAVCLDWGPWSEVGMAAREGALSRAEALGLGAISPDEGAALFGRLLAARRAHLAVVRVDWTRFGGVDPLFRRLAAPPRAVEGSAEALRQAVAGAFQMAPESLDLDASLVALGLDSVIALDLKSRIQRLTGLDVPVADLLRGPSTRDLIARIPEPTPAVADVDALSDAEVEALLNQMLAADGA